MTDTPMDDPQDPRQALETAVQGVEASQASVADAVARRRALRMARLSAASVRLEQELGAEAPDVRALRDTVDAADRWRVALNRRVERERRRPRPGPGEWTAYGQVVDHEGNPAAGLRVQLFAHHRKVEDDVGQDRTDEFGDFRIGPYRELAFCEPGEEQPELYVRVYGTRNRVVFDGKDQARFRAGRVTHFDIVLPAEDEGTRGKR